MNRICAFSAVVAAFFTASPANALVASGRPDGGLTMPDISVIGDLRGEFGSGEVNNLYIEEIELALGGFIYPEIRTEVYIALHKHGDDYDVELEEAYVDFLNLGAGFGARAGRKLIGFGKLNPIHGHAHDFAAPPLVLAEFLGDHGLAGDGVAVSWLAPLPFFLQLEAGAWRVPAADHDHGHGHGHSHGPLQDKTRTARAWSSFAAGADADLEVGLSALRGGGPHYADPLVEVRTVAGVDLTFPLRRNVDIMKVYGLDLTYRRVFPGFRRLLLRAEVLEAHRRRQRFGLAAVEDPAVAYPAGAVRDAQMRNRGFYAEANWRWSQHWDAGLRYDRAQDPLNTSADHRQLATVALTRALTEETKLRAQFSHDLAGEYLAVLQFVFGIGPHAHPLE